jgi:hypothetical protein
MMISFFDGLVFRSFGECSHFKGEYASRLMQSILFSCLLIELDFSILLHSLRSAFHIFQFLASRLVSLNLHAYDVTMIK